MTLDLSDIPTLDAEGALRGKIALIAQRHQQAFNREAGPLLADLAKICEAKREAARRRGLN